MDDASELETDCRLGAILVRTAGLSLRELQQALDQQKREPARRLGDILIELAAIDAEQLADALEQQTHKRQISLLGAILVRSAGLPLKLLQQALDRQKDQPGQRLGEILIDMSAIDDAQLTAALARQQEMRKERPPD